LHRMIRDPSEASDFSMNRNPITYKNVVSDTSVPYVALT